MSEYNAGDRVCSRSRGYYHRVPGTVCRGTLSIDGDYGYIVELDNGQTVFMAENILDTPTDDDLAAFRAKQERDAAYEAARLAKIERKRQRKQEHEAALEQRRRDEQEQKQADIEAERLAHQNELRKQNARTYGLDSLKR